MKYKQKNGTKLYGFSQINLENNTKSVDRNTNWLIVIAIIIFFLVVIIGYVVYRFESGDIITKIVQDLAAC